MWRQVALIVRPATFLKTHAKAIWACVFVPVIDLLFRQIFVCFIIELHSRRVVHFGVTRHPSQCWVAQQLKEATPNGQGPRFVIRDNDSKDGSAFNNVAKEKMFSLAGIPARSAQALR